MTTQCDNKKRQYKNQKRQHNSRERNERTLDSSTPFDQSPEAISALAERVMQSMISQMAALPSDFLPSSHPIDPISVSEKIRESVEIAALKPPDQLNISQMIVETAKSIMGGFNESMPNKSAQIEEFELLDPSKATERISHDLQNYIPILKPEAISHSMIGNGSQLERTSSHFTPDLSTIAIIAAEIALGINEASNFKKLPSLRGNEPDSSLETVKDAMKSVTSQSEIPLGLDFLSRNAKPEDVNAFFKEISSSLSIDVPVHYGSSSSKIRHNKSIQTAAEPFRGTFYDVHLFRNDFPVLHRKVHGKPLIWFDNAATTQKPMQVIKAVYRYYCEYNSNIHRGAHALASEATDAYEEARIKMQRFIGADSPEEIIFVRGTTEGINLVAQTFGRKNIEAGDEIILTELEHHSNIVPWQMLAKERGATLKIAPVNSRGEIVIEDYKSLFTRHTRFVAITHASNALGTVPPVEQMTKIAHGYDVPVLVDGAQAIPHMPINVKRLDADFYTFSGHKLFAPMGIGVIYGKKHYLEEMPPWQGGGSMIKHVEFEHTEFNKLPEKYEAGTPNVAAPIGLGAALDYLNNIGMGNIARYEQELLSYGTKRLLTIPGLKIIGTARDKVSVFSFIVDGVPPEAIAKELDAEGIAVREGHHCAQPILRHFNLTSTVRASLAFYNTKDEIDKMIQVLSRIQKRWGMSG